MTEKELFNKLPVSKKTYPKSARLREEILRRKVSYEPKSLIDEESTSVNQRNRDYSGESSPYWNWAATHQRNIPLRSDPDEVSDEADTPWDVQKDTGEVNKRVKQLLELSKQILTEKQYKVFFLLTERALTEREAAKVLGVRQQTVHDIWEGARKKLKRAYEQRTA